MDSVVSILHPKLNKLHYNPKNKQQAEDENDERKETYQGQRKMSSSKEDSARGKPEHGRKNNGRRATTKVAMARMQKTEKRKFQSENTQKVTQGI